MYYAINVYFSFYFDFFLGILLSSAHPCAQNLKTTYRFAHDITIHLNT